MDTEKERLRWALDAALAVMQFTLFRRQVCKWPSAIRSLKREWAETEVFDVFAAALEALEKEG